MKTLAVLAAVLSVAAASSAEPATPAKSEKDSSAKVEAPKAELANPAEAGKKSSASKKTTIKPLTEEEQKRLLDQRLKGGMGETFNDFANMFLVTSFISFGKGVGLATADKEIAELELQSPFPEAYHPTLREFLDAIALQTFSDWKYDPSVQFVEDKTGSGKPVDNLAIFEFKKTKREKPYTIKLADGWKSIDNGNWVMHVPPDFPVGMDIYEMGTYSPSEKDAPKDFAGKIRSMVSLEWAQRMSRTAKAEDLKPAKVGELEALYFEAMVPSHFGKDLRWRQWVFLSDNRCFFVVSTIAPDLDQKIFPDVEKMLESFRIKKN